MSKLFIVLLVNAVVFAPTQTFAGKTSTKQEGISWGDTLFLGLSHLIPSKPAIGLFEWRYGSIFSQEPFKSFNEDVFERLDFSKFPESISSVFPKLIPEYITLKLPGTFKTARECFEFKQKVETLILKGNDESLDLATRRDAHRDALLEVIKVSGPHAVKQFQLFSSKDKSDWVMSAINLSRSSLPPRSKEEVKGVLLSQLRDKNENELADHFDEYLQFEGVPKAGSVGTIVFAKYRESPKSEQWKNIVIKIPKPGVANDIKQDAQDLSEVFDRLVQKGAISEHQAQSFSRFNEQLIQSELREVDPARENANLDRVGTSYEGQYIHSVKRVKGPLLDTLTDSVVAMERAPGVSFGGHLERLRNLLETTREPESRVEILREISAMRRAFAEFAHKNTANVLDNSVVYSDPHSGNFNWNYDETTGEGALREKAEGAAYVFDFGSVIDPAANSDEHLQLKRFLFHLNLSAGTGDANYLKIFYDKYYANSSGETRKVSKEKLGELFGKVQVALDKIKKDSKSTPAIPVDDALRKIIDVIAKEAIENADSYGADILPDAIVELGRTNTLIAEGLEELSELLKGSRFETDIPYLDRTQLGIAIKASLQGRKQLSMLLTLSGIGELLQRGWALTPWAQDFWTKEAWDYFREHIGDVGQLEYEQKFLNGILGLSGKSRFEQAKIIVSSWADSVFLNIADLISSERAIGLYEWRYGDALEQDPYRGFSRKIYGEIETSSFPESIVSVFPKVIPEYIKAVLPKKLKTARACLEFKRRVESLIAKGNDDSLDDALRSQALTDVLMEVMKISGPHAIKQFQLMGSKDKSDWILAAVNLSKVDLSPVSPKDVRRFLIDDFRANGGSKIADHFDDLIQFEDVPTDGFLGNLVYARYRESVESDEWKRIVIKIPRQEVVDAIRSDGAIFSAVFGKLAKNGTISEHQAQAFVRMNEQLVQTELQELDPELENENLDRATALYEGKRIHSVKRVQSNVFDALKGSAVITERSPGIPFGVRLGELKGRLKKVRNPDQRNRILEEISAMRSAYVEFAQVNTANVLDYNVTYNNPQAESFSWEYSQVTGEGKIQATPVPAVHLREFGSMIHPAATHEEHLHLKRFLFHVGLSASTGDANYLRLFYLDSGGEFRTLSQKQVDELVEKVQVKLNAVRDGVETVHAINVDATVREIVHVIVGEAIDSSGSGSNELLPNALIKLGRSNAVIAMELEGLTEELKGSTYERDLPYLDRNQLGISIKAAILGGQELGMLMTAAGIKELLERARALSPWSKDSWSPGAWEYFKSKNTDLDHLKYGKKFAYGILGLNEEEARKFDIGLGTGVVAGTALVTFGAKKLGTKIARWIRPAPPKGPSGFGYPPVNWQKPYGTPGIGMGISRGLPTTQSSFSFGAGGWRPPAYLRPTISGLVTKIPCSVPPEVATRTVLRRLVTQGFASRSFVKLVPKTPQGAFIALGGLACSRLGTYLLSGGEK